MKDDYTLKGVVVVQCRGRVPEKHGGCTYDPICRIQSTRMSFAIAKREDWLMLQLDVHMAFINAEVQ